MLHEINQKINKRSFISVHLWVAELIFHCLCSTPAGRPCHSFMYYYYYYYRHQHYDDERVPLKQSYAQQAWHSQSLCLVPNSKQPAGWSSPSHIHIQTLSSFRCDRQRGRYRWFHEQTNCLKFGGNVCAVNPAIDFLHSSLLDAVRCCHSRLIKHKKSETGNSLVPIIIYMYWRR